VGEDVPPGAGGADAEQPAPIGNQDEAEEPSEPAPPATGPKYQSEPIYLGVLDAGASRCDIEFHNVDHAGASYEGRVYLDNPEADENTGYDDPSYAGSYHVFGHGGCLLEEGHCDVKPRRRYDPRPAHPLTKAKKVVIATDAVKRAIADDRTVSVTVVPIIAPLPYDVDPKYTEDPLDIGYVRIISYR
jgi:hypothetical protein